MWSQNQTNKQTNKQESLNARINSLESVRREGIGISFSSSSRRGDKYHSLHFRLFSLFLTVALPPASSQEDHLFKYLRTDWLETGEYCCVDISIVGTSWRTIQEHSHSHESHLHRFTYGQLDVVCSYLCIREIKQLNFTDQQQWERAKGMTKVLQTAGFVDSFRHLYPNRKEWIGDSIPVFDGDFFPSFGRCLHVLVLPLWCKSEKYRLESSSSVVAMLLIPLCIIVLPQLLQDIRLLHCFQVARRMLYSMHRERFRVSDQT